MNPKILILRLFLNPEVWAKNRHYVNVRGDKHLETLYRLLDQTHEKLNRVMTLDEFKSIVHGSGATERDKDKDTYEQIFKVLSEADVSEEILNELLKQIKQRDIAEKLAVVAFDVAEGKATLTDLNAIHAQFELVDSAVNGKEPVNDDLDYLLDNTISKPGLRWRLNTLNRSLGSLRPGDFGFIFARPETGKTTFLASEVSHFATQTDKPILWINNEEQGTKVNLRLFQAALGVSVQALQENRDEYRQRYREVTKGNIRVFDDASFHRRDIEDLCSRHSPSLVIIDQIDKIKGFNGDREDIKFGHIYQWARELAKKHCPVIGVCQADGSGEGVKWLNMNHVSGAKTAKQAEADFIIGIGKTSDVHTQGMRYINISKNKLMGDPDSDPNRRHGFFEVMIEPQIGRYRDTGT